MVGAPFAYPAGYDAIRRSGALPKKEDILLGRLEKYWADVAGVDTELGR